MNDITTDAQASATELQQQAAADYASAQAAHAWQTHRDDANVHGPDRNTTR